MYDDVLRNITGCLAALDESKVHLQTVISELKACQAACTERSQELVVTAAKAQYNGFKHNVDELKNKFESCRTRAPVDQILEELKHVKGYYDNIHKEIAAYLQDFNVARVAASETVVSYLKKLADLAGQCAKCSENIDKLIPAYVSHIELVDSIREIKFNRDTENNYEELITLLEVKRKHLKCEEAALDNFQKRCRDIKIVFNAQKSYVEAVMALRDATEEGESYQQVNTCYRTSSDKRRDYKKVFVAIKHLLDTATTQVIFTRICRILDGDRRKIFNAAAEAEKIRKAEEAEQRRKADTWVCQRCTFRNPTVLVGSINLCQMCAGPRPKKQGK